MRVKFKDVTGSELQIDLKPDSWCPVCCGTLVTKDKACPEKGLRCTSCGLMFENVEKKA